MSSVFRFFFQWRVQIVTDTTWVHLILKLGVLRYYGVENDVIFQLLELLKFPKHLWSATRKSKTKQKLSKHANMQNCSETIPYTWKKKTPKKNKTTHTVTYCRNNVTTCMSHRFEFACMFYESVRCIVFTFSSLHMLALVASTCFYYVKLDFFWHPNNVNLSPIWKNTAPAGARCAWIHWKLETFDCPNRVQPTVPGKRRGPR